MRSGVVAVATTTTQQQEQAAGASTKPVGECSSISTSSRFKSDGARGAAWRALRATELEVAAIWDRFVTSACDASDASAGAAETDAQAALRDVLLRLDPQRKRIRIAADDGAQQQLRVRVERADAGALREALVVELARRMAVARRRLGAFRATEHHFRHCDDPRSSAELVDFQTLSAARRLVVGAARCALTERQLRRPSVVASSASAWTLAAHPGFTFIQNALSADAQLDLAQRCVGWAAASDAVTNMRPLAVPSCGAAAAPPTLPKGAAGALTWATLGLHWDWERRRYIDAPTTTKRGFSGTLPPELVALGVDVAAATGHRDFAPEAAILNFYTLPRHVRMGGHRDDGEEALGSPVVSLSVGHAAVFVLGAPCDPGGHPIEGGAAHALLIRSGDAVVLSGASRLAMHGIATVLPRQDVELPVQLCAAAATRVAAAAAADAAVAAAAVAVAVGKSPTPAATMRPVGGAVAAAIAFLCAGRINVNVRQHRE